LIVKTERDQCAKSQTQNHPTPHGSLLHMALPPAPKSSERKKRDKDRKAVVTTNVRNDLIEDCAKPANCGEQQAKKRQRCYRFDEAEFVCGFMRPSQP